MTVQPRSSESRRRGLPDRNAESTKTKQARCRNTGRPKTQQYHLPLNPFSRVPADSSDDSPWSLLNDSWRNKLDTTPRSPSPWSDKARRHPADGLTKLRLDRSRLPKQPPRPPGHPARRISSTVCPEGGCPRYHKQSSSRPVRRNSSTDYQKKHVALPKQPRYTSEEGDQPNIDTPLRSVRNRHARADHRSLLRAPPGVTHPSVLVQVRRDIEPIRRP